MRDVLYELARSDNGWERRAAIVSTWYLIREGDLDDTYRITELLLGDDHDLIHKATGWMLRYAGDVDRQRLLMFPDEHAATMPATLLRAAMEHLDADHRQHYRSLRQAGERHLPTSRSTDPSRRRKCLHGSGHIRLSGPVIPVTET